ncbi:MAG: PQQ-dependent sugar dehydrogenase [Bacteroidota bacterium]
MSRKTLWLLTLLLLGFMACNNNNEEDNPTIPNPSPNPGENPSITTETVLTGLQHPWGMAFIDDNTWLVTERNGDLLLVENGTPTALNHGLNVAFGGQGGLLDIKVAPDFDQSGNVYMTYSKDGNNGTSTTALVRFTVTNGTIENMEELFEASPYNGGRLHFGSRIAFDNDGHVFVSLGDRFAYNAASAIINPSTSFPQDLRTHWGKVVRLNLDGSVPTDNPFVNQSNALSEVFSYGHRNPQGIAFDLSRNELFVNEHGAQGGDEINLINAGNNYGWPIISYGRDYNGQSIGEGSSKAGLEQPLRFYNPSVAPSSHLIYTGDVYPEWEGNHFMTSLANRTLFRLSWDGSNMEQEEILYRNRLGRIRSIAQSPDGHLYLLIDDDDGEVVKLVVGE